MTGKLLARLMIAVAALLAIACVALLVAGCGPSTGDQVVESQDPPPPTFTAPPAGVAGPETAAETPLAMEPSGPIEPREPVVLVDLAGEGPAESTDFEVPACYKAVFAWSANLTGSGRASLIVHLLARGSGEQLYLVNDIGAGLAGPLTGEVVQPLAGGRYALRTENTSQAWHIVGTCYDGQAPVGQELAAQGQGGRVTANASLPACRQSVFTWSVTPGSGGAASLVVDLHDAAGRQSVPVVNAFETVESGDLAGEALQPIAAGTYFLAVSNASGPWSVTWSCRD